MKIVLTGSLGHIGRPLTGLLVQQGHDVTVISSQRGKQAEIATLGARAAIGSIEDADFLADTFMGADAVYCMLLAPDFRNPDLDLIATAHRVAANYADAITRSGVKRVVHLSSIGAHMTAHSGLIMMHRIMEDKLMALPGIGVTFMRPTAFYYNLLSFTGTIKNAGAIASNYGGDDVVAWVAPVDIAAAIAAEIEMPPEGHKVVYVASEELTCTAVAGILGAAIGKPDLQWLVIGDEQMQAGMEAFGLAKGVAAGLVEMNARMHDGALFADYRENRPVLGPTKLVEFAKEFAAAYNASEMIGKLNRD